MLQGLQWGGWRKETNYYETNHESLRCNGIRINQMDIKNYFCSVKTGLRIRQHNSSSICNDGKIISFMRENGSILRR